MIKSRKNLLHSKWVWVFVSASFMLVILSNLSENETGQFISSQSSDTEKDFDLSSKIQKDEVSKAPNEVQKSALNARDISAALSSYLGCVQMDNPALETEIKLVVGEVKNQFSGCQSVFSGQDNYVIFILTSKESLRFYGKNMRIRDIARESYKVIFTESTIIIIVSESNLAEIVGETKFVLANLNLN